MRTHLISFEVSQVLRIWLQGPYWQHSSLSGPKVIEKIKYYEYGPWNHILSASFSSKLMNGQNKLECDITLGLTGLQYSRQ